MEETGQKHTKHLTGMISELTAQKFYASQGWEIFTPALTQSSVDFIILKDGVVKKIQVKTAYWFKRASGARYLQCTIRKGSSKTHSEYDKSNCDEVIIVYEEEVWVIPIEEMPNPTTIKLRKDVTKPRKNYAGYDPDKWLKQEERR